MKWMLIGKDRWVNLYQMGYAYFDPQGSLCLNQGGLPCIVDKEYTDAVLKAIKAGA